MQSVGSLGRVFAALAEIAKQDRNLINMTNDQIKRYVGILDSMKISKIYTKLVKPEYFITIVSLNMILERKARHDLEGYG